MVTNERKYNRRREDIGNVISLEHVNVCIPRPKTGHAVLHYRAGADARSISCHQRNEYVGQIAGRTQFHLPTRDPLVVRGTIGLVIPTAQIAGAA